jgi:hypothetical protein
MWWPVSIQLLCRTRWLSNRGFLIQELLLVLHIKHEANCGNGSKQKPHGTGAFLAVMIVSFSIVFCTQTLHGYGCSRTPISQPTVLKQLWQGPGVFVLHPDSHSERAKCSSICGGGSRGNGLE